jgi:hypothetical protein
VGGRGREWGQGEEMTQVLYAHMSNKTKKKEKEKKKHRNMKANGS